MLAAFGRGALGTLTQRFGQYDAAVESVATHEGQIASINQGKTSWANGGTITSEVYYKILNGTQDSFTLPFDLNGFVSGITANGNAQRYSGVMFAVSYANKPGQPKQRSDTLYLPFAAVNADKGVVAFEDLQFRYTDLAGTDVDVRYKVTPVSGSQIKLEKVEESASAELPWLDLSPADDEELNNFINAFALAGQTGEAQEYALTAHEAVDITKYRGIVIDIASEGIHFKTPFVVSDGTYRICAETFIANSEYVLACKCADSKLWLTLTNISSRDMFQYQSTFAKTSDLSDYAKKTDIPQQPMTLLVCGDNGNTTDMIGDTFTLTPTKLTNGSVDYFAVGLTDQMASRLNALFVELNKAQDPHGSDVYVADTNPVNMLPTLMLTFYDGSTAYRFDAIESSPGNVEFKFKGNIPGTSGGISTWLAVLTLVTARILEFRLIK